MKTIKKTIALLVIVLVIATSCDKTRSTSNNFISGAEWTVTEMTVDGVTEDELPTWEIGACEIYETSCEGHWKNDEGGETSFIWQIRDQGKTFEISHQGEEDDDHDGHDHDHDHDHAGIEVAMQAYNFSGVYEVIESSTNMMHFQTTVALGHTDKTVVIKITKQ